MSRKGYMPVKHYASFLIRKRVLLGFLAFIAGIFVIFQQANVIVVTRTNHGFEPSTITIRKGQRVQFVSIASGDFWPASNLHPTHELYDQFDPKRPLHTGETWQFTFGKEGIWTFHDHLAPNFEGVIVVVGETGWSKNVMICDGKPETEIINCIRSALRKTVQSDGIRAGFQLVGALYYHQEVARESCHALVHDLGEEAYALFIQKKDFVLDEDTSLCHFGFYHGFMEAHVRNQADAGQARSFCAYVDAQTAQIVPDSELQCFHGIGHGTVGSHDARLWGNAQAMVEPALKLCESIAKNDKELYRCVSGVYNGIANFYLQGEYKLQIPTDNPLILCKSQPKEYQEACYGNLMPVLYSVAGEKFLTAEAYLQKNVEPDLLSAAVRYLTSYHGIRHASDNDVRQMLTDCRMLPTPLVMHCVVGYGYGLISSGKPKEEYKSAIALCESPELSSEEQGVCMKEMFTEIASLYSLEKLTKVCLQLSARFQHLCK